MAQTSNSQPTHPVITFRVNLETLHRFTSLPPSRTTLDGNETTTEADNMKNTRSTWLPGLSVADNLALKNSGQFTAYGMNATYLKKLYVTGSIDDVLVVVSES
jgi:hypothetical protein